MCGIAGIYNFDKVPINEIDLHKMIAVQQHRGPDDNGYFVDDNIGLGHCRLSIIDLSKTGHQPMSDSNKRIWCIHNGEIYNYLELKEELKSRGYHFESETDTEVIIYSYKEWGTDCVSKFNGMWAFAIWDGDNNSLFLSRDRLGVKPIYYLKNYNKFIFASEIKAILKIAPNERSPDYSELYHFLKTGIFANSDNTFFEHIKSLYPGHSIIIKNSDVKIWNYWDIKNKRIVNNNKYEENFVSLLEDSIKLRLRSNVAVGTCLSGGLDSSSIVAIQNKIFKDEIQTFSVIWEDKECDESKYINLIRKSNRITPFFVKPDSNNFFDILQKIVWHSDTPSQGPGIYAQWYLMKMAKDRVKVLLDGQGGDELLAGYFNYFFFYLKDILKNDFPSKFMKEGKKISNVIKSNAFKGVLRFLYPQLYKIFDNSKKENIFDTKFEKEYRGIPGYIKKNKNFKGELNNALYQSIKRDSLPALLHYGDRSSMAFSVEFRNPFLDYRMVEFCMNLPIYEKINNSTTKYILRKAMKDILPEEILSRKDKKGYPTPVGKWFKNTLKNQVEDIIYSNSFRNRGIFDCNTIRLLFEEHCSGKKDHTFKIWQWLTTELWFRQFIDTQV
ncbi:MAG: asparagine synthase (glutamine-hydrolyzing) [bacterium]